MRVWHLGLGLHCFAARPLGGFFDQCTGEITNRKRCHSLECFFIKKGARRGCSSAGNHIALWWAIAACRSLAKS